jgi:hypothetical protein
MLVGPRYSMFVLLWCVIRNVFNIRGQLRLPLVMDAGMPNTFVFAVLKPNDGRTPKTAEVKQGESKVHAMLHVVSWKGN